MNTAALLALALPLSAPQLKDKAPTGPAVVGRWECTALVVDGKPNPQWAGLEYEFTADGKWIIYRNGQVLDQQNRTYRLDPAAGAEAIDVTEGPAPQPAAYRVEKDGETLRLVIRTGRGERPAGPDATGEGLMTFTFRRVKSGK
jgi:uncharacterized protein (TIGR03067 family)